MDPRLPHLPPTVNMKYSAPHRCLIPCLTITTAFMLSSPQLEAGPIADTSSKIVVVDKPSPRWWIEAGPVYRGNMDITISGTSYTQLNGLNAWGPLGTNPAAGPTAGYADRTYDDGYVRMDPGTGNPAALDPDTTWFWGYDNAAQYDPAAGTLSFSSTGLVGYTEALNRALAVKDDVDAVGFEIAGGFQLLQQPTYRIDLAFGIQSVWGGDKNYRTSTYAESAGRLDLTDAYDTGGLVPGQFPAPGHRGTFDGPFDNPPVIPSPLISTNFTRTINPVDLPFGAANSINLKVNTRLQSLWVGPRISYQPAPKWSLHIDPKLTLSHVKIKASRNEQFTATDAAGATTTLAAWNDNASNGDWQLGAALSAGAQYDVNDMLYFDASIGYEWVFNDVGLNIGPNRLTYDPSGYTASIMLGYRF